MYELVWIDGTLYSRGGQVIMTGTLDECAAQFEDVVIKAMS